MSSLFQILADETPEERRSDLFRPPPTGAADANVSSAARRSCGLPAALARNSIWRTPGILALRPSLRSAFGAASAFS